MVKKLVEGRKYRSLESVEGTNLVQSDEIEYGNNWILCIYNKSK